MVIKDIYTGKPDARDEIVNPNNCFYESFIMPPNFGFSDILDTDKCFIKGCKGSGKTALLLYIDKYVHEVFPKCFTSFIYFKEFNNVAREKMDSLSKKYTGRAEESIVIDKEMLLNEQDFIYIWKWILLNKIRTDNIEQDFMLFKKNKNWDLFDKELAKISYDKLGGKSKVLPDKINVQCGIEQLSFSVCLDLHSNPNSSAYIEFVKIINNSMEYFEKLEENETKYYIFIDELEAYYSIESIFRRDLMMLRDLIFAVKEINNFSIKNGFVNLKIICSIRTEILYSIMKNVPAKELNKTTGGYEVLLSWDYNGAASINHPIFQVLLKRIQLSEKGFGNEMSLEDIYTKWFPKEMYKIPTIEFYLQQTWYRPRDIVRLLSSAQNSIASNRECFSDYVYQQSSKNYSRDSLEEIKEELNSIYSPEEIDLIFSLLRGFKSCFSLKELKRRIDEKFENTFIKDKMDAILIDLYRVGVIGNINAYSYTNCWRHRGNDGPIIDDDWKFVVHRALRQYLTISSRSDETKNIYKKNHLDSEEDLICYIIDIIKEKNLLLVDIERDGSPFIPGAIRDVFDCSKYQPGQKILCKFIEYDRHYKKQILSIVKIFSE